MVKWYDNSLPSCGSGFDSRSSHFYALWRMLSMECNCLLSGVAGRLHKIVW